MNPLLCPPVSMLLLMLLDCRNGGSERAPSLWAEVLQASASAAERRVRAAEQNLFLIPMNNAPSPSSPLNPGIAATVHWLRANGFETCDSGDGETHNFECDLPGPYVHILVAPDKLVAEADRLISLLAEIGVQAGAMNEEGSAPCVDGAYLPAHGIATITLWNVRLTEAQTKPWSTSPEIVRAGFDSIYAQIPVDDRELARAKRLNAKAERQ